MEVNRELPNLADGLDESVHVIGPGGRVLVLAYHSLEDRMVKSTFGRWAGDDAERDVPAKMPVAPPRPRPLFRVLTRRPLRPSAAEVEANPRAESARLRAVERLAGVPGATEVSNRPDIVA
jgi:16S rRNA (cytosine1402-N4)-methyltransferase